MHLLMMFYMICFTVFGGVAKDCDQAPSGSPIELWTDPCEFGGAPVCEVVGDELTCEMNWAGATVPPSAANWSIVTMDDQELLVFGWGGYAPALNIELFCCYIDDDVAPLGVSAVEITGGTMNDYVYTRSELSVPGVFYDLEPWDSTGTSFTVYGNAGWDVINGSLYASTVNLPHFLYGGSQPSIIYGAPAQYNHIEGGNDVDELHGGELDDTIYGWDYADELYGHGGKDLIKGDYGNDYIDGGDGDDFLYGEYNDDTIYGGAGNDFIYGGPDADRIHGGGGNDESYGHAGIDVVYGGLGNDEVNGGPGDDVLCDTSWPSDVSNLATCPQTAYFFGAVGTDKAWMEQYIVSGNQVCKTDLFGNDTVEEARHAVWDWADVLTPTGVEQSNSAAYAECSSLITEFGR